MSRIVRGGLMVVAAAIAGLLVAPGARAERVGTAVIGGRTVVLDADGTWKYQDGNGAAATNKKCDTIKNASVCVPGLGWDRSPNKIGNFEAVYGLRQKIFMGVIADPNGRKDGITEELQQRAILTIAAGAAKVPPSDVPVLGTSDSVVEVPGAKSITFSIVLSGTPITYHIVYLLEQDRSWQFAFWTIGKQISPEVMADIKAALKSIKVS